MFPSCELRFDTLGGDELTAGAATGLYEGDVDAEGSGFEENDGVLVWE